MTEQEAIKEFNKMVGQRMMTKQGISEEQHDLFQTTMNALKEIQQYRALGTLEELREAREKQVPKKPIEHTEMVPDISFGLAPWTSYYCPFCGTILKERRNAKYCYSCGQHIDSSKVE